MKEQEEQCPVCGYPTIWNSATYNYCDSCWQNDFMAGIVNTLDSIPD